jgi:putative nucleotidyltransferase with HDIG domain
MALQNVSRFFSKPSWFKLEQKDWLKDILIGCIFVLSLGFFLNFKEIRVDHLELNTIADKYIIAQAGFEFPDKEATHLLKDESIRDLGKIYYLQDTEILKLEKKIQDSLVDRPFWRDQLPSVTFQELIIASEALRNVLLQIKFSNQRTLTKLRQMGQFSKNYLVYDAPEGSMTVLPEDLWEQIEQMAFLVRTPATRFILEQYQKDSLVLQEDLEKQHYLSRLIKDSIPFKMTKVAAGSRIINAGDKVTARHINILKGMKKNLLGQHRFFTPLTLAGSFGLALIITLVGLVYLKTLYPYVLQSSAKKALIATVIIFTLFISKLTEHFLINKVEYLADLCRFPVLVPLVTLILAILIDRKVSMIVSQFVTLILATTLTLHYQHFLVINVVAAAITTILVKTVRKRKEIFEICAKIWLITIPLIVGINLMENTPWDYHILIDILTSLTSMILIGIFVVTILPILESTFGIVTDMTLLESADLSHPLLRRLNLEASGTYRHSLSVAALAEEAALAINANPIFCRVASLYHDIGKLSQPQYFTENQFCGFNMHQLLTPLESAQVIIAHVSEGVKLAEQYELPPSLIDVIQEHHGKGLVYYFYHAQIEQSRAKAMMIEEYRFRYPGPTPRTRESAIIMLADSIEAAYRSLDEVSEKSVGELVESIVSDKIREHQLDTSQLTFDEIEGIKKAMIHSLVSNAHSRIKYPDKPSSITWKSEEVMIHTS